MNGQILVCKLRCHRQLTLGSLVKPIEFVFILKLLHSVKHFLSLCLHRPFVVIPTKCVLTAKKMTWCGRQVATKISLLTIKILMPMRTTAADLDQFNGALSWIRVVCPDYTVLTVSIQLFLTSQKPLPYYRKV